MSHNGLLRQQRRISASIRRLASAWLVVLASELAVWLGLELNTVIILPFALLPLLLLGFCLLLSVSQLRAIRQKLRLGNGLP